MYLRKNEKKLTSKLSREMEQSMQSNIKKGDVFGAGCLESAIFYEIFLLLEFHSISAMCADFT